jgi:hypothetical protein
MARIRRRTVLADRGARGIVGVEPVVALGAQAAQLAQPERGEIAAMRHDMVANGRWRYAACFQAKPTQWLNMQLMRPAALPASSAVPTVDIRTMRHRGSMPDKRVFVRDARG